MSVMDRMFNVARRLAGVSSYSAYECFLVLDDIRTYYGDDTIDTLFEEKNDQELFNRANGLSFRMFFRK